MGSLGLNYKSLNGTNHCWQAIASGGDRAMQFIRKASDGSIVPCSPNKILIATTQILCPHKRILPIGFQTGYRTGANGIGEIIETIDEKVLALCGFNAEEPTRPRRASVGVAGRYRTDDALSRR